MKSVPRCWVGPLVREQDQPPPGQPRAALCAACGRATWAPAVVPARDVVLCRKCGISGAFRWSGPRAQVAGLVTPVLTCPGVVPHDAPASIKAALIESLNVN
jgi:hypothetical protein